MRRRERRNEKAVKGKKGKKSLEKRGGPQFTFLAVPLNEGNVTDMNSSISGKVSHTVLRSGWSDLLRCRDKLASVLLGTTLLASTTWKTSYLLTAYHT